MQGEGMQSQLGKGQRREGGRGHSERQGCRPRAAGAPQRSRRLVLGHRRGAKQHQCAAGNECRVGEKGGVVGWHGDQGSIRPAWGGAGRAAGRRQKRPCRASLGKQ